MESITLTGLIQDVGNVTKSCWRLGTSIYEIQQEKNETGSALVRLNEEVKTLCRVLQAFEDFIKQAQSRNFEKYTNVELLRAIKGPVEDCHRCMNGFHYILEEVRGKSEGSISSGLHLVELRLQMRMADLERGKTQLQNHILSMNLCFAALVVYAHSLLPMYLVS